MSLLRLLALCLAGTEHSDGPLACVRCLCDLWLLKAGWWNGQKTKHNVLCFSGVTSTKTLALLTGAAEQVYSSCDMAVTFIQSAPAAVSPQEGRHRPTWAVSVPQRREKAQFDLANAPLTGNFCCLGRKSSGGGSALILRAGWAFSTSPPFQETHFAVSSLCESIQRERVKAKGHRAVGGKHNTRL